MGGGSDGGGTTTTESHAEYPPEFRPLAEAGVRNIMDLQNVLPMAPFAEAQGGQVANLAPFTLAGMGLLPFAALSGSERGIPSLGGPLGTIGNQAINVSGPSPATQAALGALSGQLGAPTQFNPAMTAQPVAWPQVASSPTAFQGVPPSVLYGFSQNLPYMQTPTTGLPPLMPTAPPMSQQAQMFQLQQALKAMQAGGAGSSGPPVLAETGSPQNRAFNTDGTPVSMAQFVGPGVADPAVYGWPMDIGYGFV